MDSSSFPSTNQPYANDHFEVLLKRPEDVLLEVELGLVFRCKMCLEETRCSKTIVRRLNGHLGLSYLSGYDLLTTMNPCLKAR